MNKFYVDDNEILEIHEIVADHTDYCTVVLLTKHTMVPKRDCFETIEEANIRLIEKKLQDVLWKIEDTELTMQELNKKKVGMEEVLNGMKKTIENKEVL